MFTFWHLYLLDELFFVRFKVYTFFCLFLSLLRYRSWNLGGYVSDYLSMIIFLFALFLIKDWIVPFWLAFIIR